jgi:hypothetical protein
LDPGLNPGSGAVNAIAIDPTNRSVIYAGTVNGGVWKTTKGTDEWPTWTPLTDSALPALSIHSLALSPVNPNQVFVGTGSTSAFALVGSAFGVVRSDDGGQTWTVLAQNTFAGHAINSVVPTTLGGGKIVLAATLDIGVWRSADSGATFSQISGTGGLPSGGVSSLVADPTNQNVFYAAITALASLPMGPVPDPEARSFFAAVKRNAPFASESANSKAGVYRSDDGGVTWAPTSLVEISHLELASSSRILVSVGKNTGVIYAMVITRIAQNMDVLQGGPPIRGRGEDVGIDEPAS